MGKKLDRADYALMKDAAKFLGRIMASQQEKSNMSKEMFLGLIMPGIHQGIYTEYNDVIVTRKTK